MLLCEFQTFPLLKVAVGPHRKQAVGLSFAYRKCTVNALRINTWSDSRRGKRRSCTVAHSHKDLSSCGNSGALGPQVVLPWERAWLSWRCLRETPGKALSWESSALKSVQMVEWMPWSWRHNLDGVSQHPLQSATCAIQIDLLCVVTFRNNFSKFWLISFP